MSTPRLFRHARGIYYFDVAGLRVAVSETEARYSKVADAALIDDAPLLERARVLATEKRKFMRSLHGNSSHERTPSA